MVLVKGGRFTMGTNDGFPYEAPAHEVVVDDFYLDETEVTVAQFEAFVRDTGYVTEAERYKWSGVFDVRTGEWGRSDGATWRQPEGPGSSSAPQEPVVQVSWNDAVAYANWAGKRLPTEAEFEYAARGGLKGKTYAWGDSLVPGGKYLANFWQGSFPAANVSSDGYLRRAPVGSFPANQFGLRDVIGNVWEWCHDWFAEDYYQHSPMKNPKGPESGAERVVRGGSWMCSENYCTGFRVAARMHSGPDSGLDNTGFRCAKDAR